MGEREELGRWAVIAGASEGLGAAFARALAARGHDLVLIARRAGPLEELAQQLRSAHRVEVVTAAVDLAGGVDPVASLVEGREVGVLVCNAAYAPLGPFADLPLNQKLQVVDVNCRAPVALLHGVLPGMIARKKGAVVLMSSLTAFQGSPYAGIYGATKAFNLSLAEALWAEAAPHGVKVLACCAGATRTPGYLRSMPGGAPGELEPDEVVAQTLAALGSGPLLIPGAFNRLASFVLRRLLPRRVAITLMGTQTRKLLR